MSASKLHRFAMIVGVLLLTVALTPTALQSTNQAEESSEPPIYREVGRIKGTFASPTDVAIGPDGKVYVADYYDHQIEIFSADGTHIGSIGEEGVPGNDPNHLYYPQTVAVGPDGRIYVAGWGNYVKVYNSDLTYSTQIGTETNGIGNYEFYYPNDIAVSAENEIFISDSYNDRIQIYNASLEYVATISPSFDCNSGTVDLDVAGNIYVGCENEPGFIQIYDSSLNLMDTLTGNGQVIFGYELQVAISPDGKIYVLDLNRQTSSVNLHVFDSDRSYLTTVNTKSILQTWEGLIADIFISSTGVIYFASLEGNFVQVLNSDLTPVMRLNPADYSTTQLSYNDALAIGNDGKIYVGDTNHFRVQIYNADLSYFDTLDTIPSNTGELRYISSIAISDENNIFVAQHDNHNVLVFDSLLNHFATLGIPGESGNDNNHFNEPHQVLIGPDSKIYVADNGNDRIQVFDADLSYNSTIAPNPGQMQFAPDGNIYVLGETGFQIYDKDFNDIETIPYELIINTIPIPIIEFSSFIVGGDGKIYISNDGDNIIILDSNFEYLTHIHYEFSAFPTSSFTGFDIDLNNRVVANIAPYGHLVQVFAPNTAPITQADTYAIQPNSTLTTNVLANDIDNEGDPMTATVVNGPNHATTFNFNVDGSFTYIPQSNFTGQDSFTYQAGDGDAKSGITTVTINVSDPTPIPTTETPSATDQVTPDPTESVTPEPTQDPTAEVTPIVTAEPGTEPPSAPQNLNVDPRQGRPQITWADDVQAEWFHIYIGSSDYTITLLDAWIEREDYCSDGLCSIIPPIDPIAGSYHVWMQAWGYGEFSIGGDSGFDGWSHDVFDLPDSPPQAAKGLTVTSANGQHTLSWDSPTGATWYNVWLGTGAPDWTPHTFTWLSADDLGCGAGGVCDWSDIVLPTGNYVWYVKAWGPGGFSVGGMIDAPGWSQGPNIQVD